MKRLAIVIARRVALDLSLEGYRHRVHLHTDLQFETCQQPMTKLSNTFFACQYVNRQTLINEQVQHV